MMLKPSIDTLLDKYHQNIHWSFFGKTGPRIGKWCSANSEFQSVKSTLQALEEIESGNVVVRESRSKREALIVGLKQSGFAKKKSAKLRNKLPKKKKMVEKI